MRVSCSECGAEITLDSFRFVNEDERQCSTRCHDDRASRLRTGEAQPEDEKRTCTCPACARRSEAAQSAEVCPYGKASCDDAERALIAQRDCFRKALESIHRDDRRAHKIASDALWAGDNPAERASAEDQRGRTHVRVLTEASDCTMVGRDNDDGYRAIGPSRETPEEAAEDALAASNLRAGYFPTVDHLTKRNREMHDRAQKAETELAKLRRESPRPDPVPAAIKAFFEQQPEEPKPIRDADLEKAGVYDVLESQVRADAATIAGSGHNASPAFVNNGDWVPIEQACRDTSPGGDHECTRPKDHKQVEHHEVDPVFGNKRARWGEGVDPEPCRGCGSLDDGHEAGCATARIERLYQERNHYRDLAMGRAGPTPSKAPMVNCSGCIESEDGHYVSGPDADCDECGGTGKVEAMVLTAEEAAEWLADRPPCRAASADVCEDFGCETHPPLAKVAGKWPGDETDAEIQAAMNDMKQPDRGDRLWRALDELACKAAPVALGMYPAEILHKAAIKARRILDAEQAKPAAAHSSSAAGVFHCGECGATNRVANAEGRRDAMSTREHGAWMSRYRHGKASRKWAAIAVEHEGTDKRPTTDECRILAEWMAAYESADAAAEAAFRALTSMSSVKERP